MKAATLVGIYGRAGAGLTNATWAANETVARIGQKAEIRTAELLAPYGERTAIIHDVRVPISGWKANIDHVVVSGKTVYLIDTKAWKTGWYWSLNGTNMRDLKKAPPSTSKSPDYAVKAFQKYLGTGIDVRPVILAVWPSSRNGTLKLLNPAVHNCQVVHAPAIIRKLKLRRAKPGDAATVNRIKKLTQ